MPYIKSTWKAGRTIEYSFYFTPKYKKKELGRAIRKKPTSEEQKKVNQRMKERTLTMLMNENFSSKDYYLTLDFIKDKRPKTKKDFTEIMRRFLKKARDIYKKAKKVLKYIWVFEVGKKGAAHIHMLINDIDIKLIRKLWSKGGMTIKPLWDDGNYRRLAEYFLKYSEKTMNTWEEKKGKSWNPSQNLRRTRPKKKPILRINTFEKEIKIPKGWHLDEGSVQRGIHNEEYYGYTFLRYILVKT